MTSAAAASALETQVPSQTRSFIEFKLLPLFQHVELLQSQLQGVQQTLVSLQQLPQVLAQLTHTVSQLVGKVDSLKIGVETPMGHHR